MVLEWMGLIEVCWKAVLGVYWTLWCGIVLRICITLQALISHKAVSSRTKVHFEQSGTRSMRFIVGHHEGLEEHWWKSDRARGKANSTLD
jgi:hypothetical protein